MFSTKASMACLFTGKIITSATKSITMYATPVIRNTGDTICRILTQIVFSIILLAVFCQKHDSSTDAR